MKKLLLLALLAALAVHPAWSAVTLVQSATPINNSSNSTTISLTGVASGDTLIFLATNAGQPTFSSVSDSLGNTVSTAVAYTCQSGGPCLGVYYVQNASAGSHTITFTTTGTSSGGGYYLTEYSGLATSGVFDKASAVATGSGTSISTASITPASNGELLYGPIIQAFGGATFTSYTNGFTQQQTENSGPSSAWASVVQATAASVNFGATASAANVWESAIVAFKPSGGGSCTHAGQAKNGSTSVPNGSSGFYWGKTGNWVTPDCSTIYYWSPAAGNFVLN